MPCFFCDTPNVRSVSPSSSIVSGSGYILSRAFLLRPIISLPISFDAVFIDFPMSELSFAKVINCELASWHSQDSSRSSSLPVDKSMSRAICLPAVIKGDTTLSAPALNIFFSDDTSSALDIICSVGLSSLAVRTINRFSGSELSRATRPFARFMPASISASSVVASACRKM